MTELKQLDSIAGMWNDKQEEDQSEGKVSNGADNMPELSEIRGIPEGEPSAVNDDGPFNMDEEMSEFYFSRSGAREYKPFRTHEQGSTRRPLKKDPKNRQTILETGATTVKMLGKSKKEAQRQGKYT